MRRKINRMLSFGLALIMMFSIAGCGSNAQPQAEIDPDTPVSEVQFPLKETAELSFITSRSNAVDHLQSALYNEVHRLHQHRIRMNE